MQIKIFANTAKAIEALVLWVKKQTAQHIAVRFVMEATGVYHEMLAYFLEGKGYEIVSRHGIKMKAVVAVQRKLLEMIFILYKTGKRFDQDYLMKTKAEKSEQELIKIRAVI